MSKVLALFVAAVLVAVAAVIINAAGDIAMIECSDKQCRQNCRTVIKIPTGVCRTPPFRHGEGEQALCSTAAPTGLCYYFGIFAQNASAGTNNTPTCTDNNEVLLEYHQCDVCRPSFHKEGTFEKTTGCNSSTTMTLNFECDAGCAACNRTHQIKDKVCAIPQGFKTGHAVQFSAPTKCTQSIQYINYNNSACTQNANTRIEKQFADVCYSFGGRSHLYHCA